MRVADSLDDRGVEPGTLRDQTVHAAIGPLHPAIGVDGDDGILHGVEQGFELVLAGLDGEKTRFQLAGGLVEGHGDLADLVERGGGDAGGQIAGGYLLGKRHDALQAARGVQRGDRGQQHHDDESDQRSQKERVVDTLRGGFDVGERIGHANRASRDGRGDVQKRNADGVTAALIHTDVAAERRGELLATAVVFHGGRIGFGIGQHLAGRIDDGGARAGGLTFLGSDVLQGVLAVDFDAIREQAGFGGEATLDLVAQRVFPGTPDGNVERDCSDQNYQGEGEQELEENPVGHFGTSKRYPAPRTVLR